MCRCFCLQTMEHRECLLLSSHRSKADSGSWAPGESLRRRCRRRGKSANATLDLGHPEDVDSSMKTTPLQDLITFGLAFAGYVFLCLDVILHLARRPFRWLTPALASVVTVHVALVWLWRFDLSLSYALEKSLPGFVIFHAAFAFLIAAALSTEPRRGHLLLIAFPVVTAGATGAAFKYDYLSGYRFPLVGACLLAIAAGAVCWRRARRLAAERSAAGT